MKRSTMKKNSMLALAVAAIALLATTGRAEQLIDLDTLAKWRAEGHDHVLIDVRPPGLYERRHLPQAINIPLNVLEHNSLPDGVDVVFYDNDLSGLTCRRAVKAIDDKDSSRVFVLKGGLQQARLHRGTPLVQDTGVVEDAGPDPVTAEDLREALLSGMPVQIVDIRDPKSFKETRVSRSQNVPLLKHPDKVRKIGTDTIWAHAELPKNARRRASNSLKNDKQAIQDAMAEEVAAALGVARKARARTPVVLVDDGSGIGSDICRRLARDGFVQARPLERGIVSWRLLPNSMDKPIPQTETMVHGSSTVDREEIRRRHDTESNE